MAVSTSLLMASKTLATNSTSSLLRRNPTPLCLRTLSEPTTITLSLRRSKSKLVAFSSPSPPIPGQNPPNPTHSPPAGATQTITTLVALALALSKLIASKISLLSLKLGAIHPNPNNNLSTEAVGLLFFASMSDGGAPQSMGAPIAAILERLARWVEIYICVLQIRVLLSLYPNIQWDKQPMFANRDLRDPFSSLFRGILPPSFNSSDVSTALAFLLLGMGWGEFSTAAAGPLFFAPISSNGNAPGTPIAVIAMGLVTRCLEVYGRVLLIRILLSLYPNMEWDKQPMAAIRDLCDPFLGLFRGIIPPLFNSVDVSPILALLLSGSLGMLGQFAKSAGVSHY